jgi:hypothetical protein
VSTDCQARVLWQTSQSYGFRVNEKILTQTHSIAIYTYFRVNGENYGISGCKIWHKIYEKVLIKDSTPSVERFVGVHTILLPTITNEGIAFCDGRLGWEVSSPACRPSYAKCKKK